MNPSPQSAPALSSFSWEDPFLLENQILEEEKMIRESARSYCQEKLVPRVLDAFSNEKTDPAIFREMGDMGLLGTTIPEEYGGLGFGNAGGVVADEVEWDGRPYSIKLELPPVSMSVFRFQGEA